MSKIKSEKPKKPWYKKWWGILFIIFILFPAAMAGIAPSSYNSNKTVEQEPTAKAEYDIKIVDNSFASNKQRRVTFTVTNTGEASGNPECFIKVESPKGSTPYVYGQDYITWDTPLQPGERKYFEGLFDISDKGASRATHTEVSCS